MAFVWHQAESRRSGLQRKKNEREAQLQEARELAESLGHDFDLSLPFALPRPGGGAEERISVPAPCTGLLIGKKGENLKAIEKKFSVRVKLEDGAAGAKIAVVSGADAERVAAARAEIDFGYECVDLAPGSAGWVAGKGGRHLQLIRELTGVTVLRLCEEGEGDGNDESELVGPSGKQGEPRRCWLELRGLREQVANARLCVDSHLSYLPVYEEMEAMEQQLDADIDAARAGLGLRAATGTAGRGGRGRGGDDAGGKGRGRGRGAKSEGASNGTAKNASADANTANGKGEAKGDASADARREGKGGGKSERGDKGSGKKDVKGGAKARAEDASTPNGVSDAGAADGKTSTKGSPKGGFKSSSKGGSKSGTKSGDNNAGAKGGRSADGESTGRGRGRGRGRA